MTHSACPLQAVMLMHFGKEYKSMLKKCANSIAHLVFIKVEPLASELAIDWNRNGNVIEGYLHTYKETFTPSNSPRSILSNERVKRSIPSSLKKDTFLRACYFSTSSDLHLLAQVCKPGLELSVQCV